MEFHSAKLLAWSAVVIAIPLVLGLRRRRLIEAVALAAAVSVLVNGADLVWNFEITSAFEVFTMLVGICLNSAIAAAVWTVGWRVTKLFDRMQFSSKTAD